MIPPEDINEGIIGKRVRFVSTAYPQLDEEGVVVGLGPNRDTLSIQYPSQDEPGFSETTHLELIRERKKITIKLKF